MNDSMVIAFQVTQAQPAIVQQILAGAARGLYPTSVAVLVAEQTERLRETLIAEAARSAK